MSFASRTKEGYLTLCARKSVENGGWVAAGIGIQSIGRWRSDGNSDARGSGAGTQRVLKRREVSQNKVLVAKTGTLFSRFCWGNMSFEPYSKSSYRSTHSHTRTTHEKYHALTKRVPYTHTCTHSPNPTRMQHPPAHTHGTNLFTAKGCDTSSTTVSRCAVKITPRTHAVGPLN